MGSILSKNYGKKIIFYGIVLFLLLGVFGWKLTSYLVRHGRGEIEERAEYNLKALKGFLDYELEHDNVVSSLLSKDLSFLNRSYEGDEHYADLVNSALDIYAKTMPDSVAYFMDLNGTVLYSSNRDSEDSFVGKNYGFRPYFKKALEDGSSSYFALGITSGKRGYYSGYAAKDDSGNTFGVCVIKTDVDDLGVIFQDYGKSFFVNKDGVIFLSGAEELLFKSIWPITEERKDELIDSKQFGAGPFENISVEENSDNTVSIGGVSYYLAQGRVNAKGWSVVVLEPLDKGIFYMVTGLAITVFMFAIVFGLFVFLAHREIILTRIRENKEYAELLFEFIPSAIFTVDTNKAVTSWNKKAEEITGFSRTEVVGKQCITFAEEPCKEICGLFTDSLDKPITNKECKIKSRDGRIKIISKNADLLKNSNGKVIGGIESFVDITKQKAWGKKLEDTRLQLFESEKLAAIGTLAAGAAHELNNPLMGVIGFMQHIKGSMKAEDLNYKLIETSERELKRCSRIIQDLLTFSGKNKKGVSGVNINNIIDKTVDMVGYQAKHDNILIKKELAVDLPLVAGNVDELQQVALNMVSNARDALKSAKEKIITIKTIHEGDYVRIEFRDSGCGIAKENIVRIFDPFFTTKDTGKGTGLGLSIVKNIIEGYKGVVTVESDPGGGKTIFTIILKVVKK